MPLIFLSLVNWRVLDCVCVCGGGGGGGLNVKPKSRPLTD